MNLIEAVKSALAMLGVAGAIIGYCFLSAYLVIKDGWEKVVGIMMLVVLGFGLFGLLVMICYWAD